MKSSLYRPFYEQRKTGPIGKYTKFRFKLHLLYYQPKTVIIKGKLRILTS